MCQLTLYCDACVSPNLIKNTHNSLRVCLIRAMGKGKREKGKELLPMPYAQCPMPIAQCPIRIF
jgi:hypothetical protein